MKKKSLLLISVGLILCLVAVGIYLISSKESGNVLTKKEKLEDFDYLYDVITYNQPMLDNYKKLLGYDFAGNREYYRDLIRDTKDDYEFYVVMDMIMEEFPGIHTSLRLDTYQDVLGSGSTYSNRYERLMKEKDITEYWTDYMIEYATEGKGGTSFQYYDGQYVSGISNFAENVEQTLILLEIDGEPIDEYIKRKEVNGEIVYDAFLEKVCRRSLELNLSHGKVVTATFQNMDGAVFEGEVCIRTKDSAFERHELEPIIIPDVEMSVLEEVKVSAIQLDEKAGGDFDVYVDEERKLSYVALFNFMNDDGELLAEAMKVACEQDNIIFDMRINAGGYREYFIENVYPWLYEGDVECDISFDMYQHTIYGYVTGNIQVAGENTANNWELVERLQTLVCKGEAKQDKKVYVLIDGLGASAADWVAHLFKEHTSAVVIGTQTGGEGIGLHFTDIMPNSRLPFQVQCAQAFNPDGTDNSIIGTTADIYIPHTVESIAKKEQVMREGGSYLSYENRLKWDNVLLETLKIIEQNEQKNMAALVK